ncbi:unnamed protein product [Pleuronectes platessa]|uniref:Uncharacterized protein n=1 Tax=Pleuronectes platessa TaxID=8262 RepID=A0A9N7VSC6_PLEPL|nr:unnamed protein product [Pleuronectes platessa]
MAALKKGSERQSRAASRVTTRNLLTHVSIKAQRESVTRHEREHNTTKEATGDGGSPTFSQALIQNPGMRLVCLRAAFSLPRDDTQTKLKVPLPPPSTVHLPNLQPPLSRLAPPLIYVLISPQV